MKKHILVIISICFSLTAFAQTEIYISPLPFVSGFQASASVYGFTHPETGTIEYSRFDVPLLSTSIIKNKRYKYTISITANRIAANNFRIKRNYLLNSTLNEKLFFSNKSKHINAIIPQFEFSITKLFNIRENYFLGLGLNTIAYYIENYPPIIYMVEHDVYDIVYSYGQNIEDKKIGYLEKINFTRKNHLNYGLGPSIQFGCQIHRIRIEAFANLIFKSPEFYDVEHTIYPVNYGNITGYTAKHAQFPTPVYQLGLALTYKILEL